MKKVSEKVIFSMKGVFVNDEIRGAVKALEASGKRVGLKIIDGEVYLKAVEWKPA